MADSTSIDVPRGPSPFRAFFLVKYRDSPCARTAVNQTFLFNARFLSPQMFELAIEPTRSRDAAAASQALQ